MSFILLTPLLSVSGEENLKDYLRGAVENEAQYKKYYARPDSGIVATVGQHGWITDQDIDDYVAAQNCYPETTYQRKHALLKLIEITISEEILRLYYDDHLTKLEELLEAEKGLEAGGRSADIIGCMKNHSGNEVWRYWRIFLRPLVLNEPGRQFGRNDPRVQWKTYALRDRVNGLLDKNWSLKKISDHLALDTSTHAFTCVEKTMSLKKPKKKAKPGEPGDRDQMMYESEANFIKTNLLPMKPGEVKRPKAEDDNIEYMELVKASSPTYTYATFNIQRAGLDDFMKDKPKIKIKCLSNLDPEILQYMRERHGKGSGYIEVEYP